MGVKSTIKNGFKRAFNPVRWIGYENLKEDTSRLKQISKSVLARPDNKSERNETFEEAVKRLNLTEEDIQKRIKSAKDLVSVFLVMGGLLFGYMIYQWMSGYFVGGLICLILMLLVSLYAFREHFNLFQMRQRRLGCSRKEWLLSLFKGSK